MQQTGRCLERHILFNCPCEPIKIIIFLLCHSSYNLHNCCSYSSYNSQSPEGRKGKMEEQVEMVGKAFVDHYYHLFDNDRPSLALLYQPTSMLTFEGQKIQGTDNIIAKLVQLPFQQCHHVISTIDSQLSSFAGGILVFVSGTLQLQGEDHPLRFSQMFHLIPTVEGSFFVLNDIFRLNYA